MSRLRVFVPEGQNVRLRYYFWKPIVFLSGSLRHQGATPVSGGAGQAAIEGPVKACPRCAEPVRVEARVCRHCGHEFAEADVAQAVAAIEAARSAFRDARQASDAIARVETSQRLHLKRAQHAVVLTILLVQIGLIMPAAGAAQMQEANPGGDLPPSFVAIMLGAYGVFGALAFWQWRRAKRVYAELTERAAVEGNYFTCVCGEPKKPYY